MLKKLLILGLLLGSVPSFGQLWSGILDASRAKDWSTVGVAGGIPVRNNQCGATLTPLGGGQDDTPQIQAAVNNVVNSTNGCSHDQVVKLGPGTFHVNSAIILNTNVVVRGSGETQTIVDSFATNATIFQMGNNQPSTGTGLINSFSTYASEVITSGATAGSTSITVASQPVTPYAAGQYLIITEQDDNSVANATGSSGLCTACDTGAEMFWQTHGQGPWAANKKFTGGTGDTGGLNSYITDTARKHLFQFTTCNPDCTTGSTQPTWDVSAPGATTAAGNGTNTVIVTYIGPVVERTRGELVTIQTVSGGGPYTITFTPALARTKTLLPLATHFGQSKSVGVENLHVKAENQTPSTSGGFANFFWLGCFGCWMNGVQSDYADRDHADVFFSSFGQITDSDFENSYLHKSGTSDTEVDLARWSEGILVQNNIFARLHVSIVLEWGATGNVIAYNYTTGEFDTTAGGSRTAAIVFHGASPEDNLFEGNVTAQIGADSTWGTSAYNTFFRNHVRGDDYICTTTDPAWSASVTYNLGDVVNFNGASWKSQQGGNLNNAPNCLSGPCVWTSWWKQTRGTIDCSTFGYYSQPGVTSWLPFQGVAAVAPQYQNGNMNFVANVVGSPNMRNVMTNNGTVSRYGNVDGTGAVYAACNATITTNCGCGSRAYQNVVYDYAFGYTSISDTGCSANSTIQPFTSALVHGDYELLTNAVVWERNVPAGHNPLHPSQLPPTSFYLTSGANSYDCTAYGGGLQSKPCWFNGSGLPWPSIGPDVVGGDPAYAGHVQTKCTIPAQCLFYALHGADGGQGTPTAFDHTLYYSGTPPTTFNLTATTDGHGTLANNPVGSSCGANCQTYNSGQVVVTTATANTGYIFNAWTGCPSPSSNQCTSTMSTDHVISASFTLQPTASISFGPTPYFCSVVNGPCTITVTVTVANLAALGYWRMVDSDGNYYTDTVTGKPVVCAYPGGLIGGSTDFCLGAPNGTFTVHFVVRDFVEARRFMYGTAQNIGVNPATTSTNLFFTDYTAGRALE